MNTFVHEEQRLDELSLPMFQLEQRTEKLEGKVESLILQTGKNLIGDVSYAINRDIMKSLPAVYQEFVRQ